MEKNIGTVLKKQTNRVSMGKKEKKKFLQPENYFGENTEV